MSEANAWDGIDAIIVQRDGVTRVTPTATACRICGGPIESPDVPYCDPCAFSVADNHNGKEDVDWDSGILARIDGLALAASDADNAEAYRHAQKAYHYVYPLMSDLFGMGYAESVKGDSR